MSIDPALAIRVQRELGALISQPALTDKLLDKPPFRFLHDIACAVAAATGFLDGVFSEVELDARALADKASKVAFLEKLIAAIEAGAGAGAARLEVRPSKIVAGSEPDKTCVMLLALARAARRHAREGGGGAGGGSASGGDRVGGGSASVDRVPLLAPTPASRAPPASTRRAAQPAAPPEPTARPALAALGPSSGARVAVATAAPVPAAAPTSVHVPTTLPAPMTVSASTTVPASLPTTAPSSTPAPLPAPSPAPRPPSVGATDVTIGTKWQSPAALGADESIERTAEILQPLVGPRPKLTATLLSRPPWRFLHDVVMAVMQVTGWGALFFDQAACNPERAGADRDAKVAFLATLVDALALSLNTTPPAMPAKVVAGLEPQATRQTLQLLALAGGHAARGGSWAPGCTPPEVAARLLLQQRGVSDPGAGHASVPQRPAAPSAPSSSAPSVATPAYLLPPPPPPASARAAERRGEDSGAGGVTPAAAPAAPASVADAALQGSLPEPSARPDPSAWANPGAREAGSPPPGLSPAPAQVQPSETRLQEPPPVPQASPHPQRVMAPRPESAARGGRPQAGGGGGRGPQAATTLPRSADPPTEPSVIVQTRPMTATRSTARGRRAGSTAEAASADAALVAQGDRDMVGRAPTAIAQQQRDYCILLAEDDGRQGSSGLEAGVRLLGSDAEGGRGAGVGAGKHTRDILHLGSGSGGTEGGGGARHSPPPPSSCGDAAKLSEAVRAVAAAAAPLVSVVTNAAQDLQDMRVELRQWQDDARRHVGALLIARQETAAALVPLRMRLAELDERIGEAEADVTRARARINAKQVVLVGLLGGDPQARG